MKSTIEKEKSILLLNAQINVCQFGHFDKCSIGSSIPAFWESESKSTNHEISFETV